MGKILNGKKFKAGITKQFFEKIEKNKFEIQNELNQIVGTVIDELKVYDSGATKRATSSSINTFSDTAVIRITTVKSSEMATFYPIYPYFGRGTSRKYGPRRWLEIGLNRWIKKNKLKIN